MTDDREWEPDEIADMRAAVGESLMERAGLGVPQPRTGRSVIEQCEQTLWAVFLSGPDEMHPAVSWDAAFEEATQTNVALLAAGEVDPGVQAIARRWTGTAEKHAEMLAKREEA